MAQRERTGLLTDAEIVALAEAADDLGERVVRALSEETGRPAEDFDVDPHEYEFPGTNAGEDA